MILSRYASIMPSTTRIAARLTLAQEITSWNPPHSVSNLICWLHRSTLRAAMIHPSGQARLVARPAYGRGFKCTRKNPGPLAIPALLGKKDISIIPAPS